jgi:hypothetical protein
VSVNARVGPKGEPLFDPPSDAPPMEAVRGSVMVVDWRWLRENGVFDAYASALGASRRLLDVTAGEWVSFPFAMDHWRAIESLGLPAATEHAIGKYLGERVHNVVLNTLIRLAGHLGVTPWVALEQAHKLWLRSWRGGGLAAYRTGDDSARVEVLNAHIVRSHTFRNALGGTIEAGIAPFCRKPVISERVDERTGSSMVLRVSWEPSGLRRSS